ncbi:nitrite reductase small subunit NirD [Pseudomonas mosselii]|uniref:nitrite reductase small subunit NirD n=1 Tax=Pseudomonas mosselii TaxID=78327 RepID=UPI000D8A486D|nr:nitrite reductase small subunit NirD [Pseudomonas mosselii]PYC21273.1 nitrite reductase (NAD(P)H) small subunit [Pseudomonas mosselii]
MDLSNAVQTREITWQRVCGTHDLVADSGVVVWHEGEQVALFYLPGQTQTLYAIANRDPRSSANIIGRGLLGEMQGTLVVAAPLYKQHFCLANGKCLEDPQQSLQVWQARLSGDAVELALT